MIQLILVLSGQEYALRYEQALKSLGVYSVRLFVDFASCLRFLREVALPNLLVVDLDVRDPQAVFTGLLVIQAAREQQVPVLAVTPVGAPGLPLTWSNEGVHVLGKPNGMFPGTREVRSKVVELLPVAYTAELQKAA